MLKYRSRIQFTARIAARKQYGLILTNLLMKMGQCTYALHAMRCFIYPRGVSLVLTGRLSRETVLFYLMELIPVTNSGSQRSEVMSYVISISGGKDSTALLLWAIENLPNDELYPVFADTGNEHELTLEYVDYLEQVTGIKIERVRAEKLFGELVKEKQIFPCNRPGLRWCTLLLKVDPIKKYIQQFELPVLMVGIRRSESDARKCALEYKWDDYYRCDVWQPLVNWSVEQVFEIMKRHDIKANPLYYKGFSRVGCMPCINARKDEIELIARMFPEHIDKVRQWE